MPEKNLLKYDYILVGQGLAGTVLAFELLKQHQRILIIDEPQLSKASQVAVGLYNPVVLKKIEKSWLADTLLPQLNSFYREMELLFNKQLHFKKDIVKLFTEASEIALWEKRLTEEVGTYLTRAQSPEMLEKAIYAGIGYALVNQAGYVDVSTLLAEARDYFKQQDNLQEAAFDLKELTVNEKNIYYKNTTASKIIFCEGHLVSANPYFNWLPLNPSKGEILVIEVHQKHTAALVQMADKVINKGVFIVPVGSNKFKIGATYSWNALDEIPTDSGKKELLQKLEKLLKLPFTVIDHKAAVRPNVHDRRPLIGLHPQHKTLAIFNGLGSKGVMLAPYFAEQFVNFLLHEKPIHPEADIARCYKKFKSVQ